MCLAVLETFVKTKLKNSTLTRNLVTTERRQLIENTFYCKENNENWHVMKLFLDPQNVSCLTVNSYRKKEKKISAYTFV